MPQGVPAGRRSRHSGLLSAVDSSATDWAFRLVAIGYVALSLGDCMTTSYVLANGGHERNPIAASIYASYGIGALFALKVAIVAVIVVTLRHLPRRPAVWVGMTFSAAMAFVVSANLGAIALH